MVVGTHVVNLTEANPDPFRWGLKKQRHCNITVQSPEDISYNGAPIFLNFTVKKVYVSDTYSYFYILDGQEMQSAVRVEEIQLVGQETVTNDTPWPYVVDTLEGQAVLSNLPDGQHNLTVFVGWMAEDGAISPANLDPFSTTARFSVDTANTMLSPSPSPQETEKEPFPTTWVASGIVAVTVASTGLMLFLKKRFNKG